MYKIIDIKKLRSPVYYKNNQIHHEKVDEGIPLHYGIITKLSILPFQSFIDCIEHINHTPNKFYFDLKSNLYVVSLCPEIEYRIKAKDMLQIIKPK